MPMQQIWLWKYGWPISLTSAQFSTRLREADIVSKEEEIE